MRLFNVLILFWSLSSPSAFFANSPISKSRTPSVAPFRKTASAAQKARPSDPSRKIQSHSSTKKDDEETDAEVVEAQRRIFGVSIVMSLADEARGFKDPALSARVLARAGDALWDTDPQVARLLFRRAWEAAEKADNAEGPAPLTSSAPVMVITLSWKGAGDSRSEVLNITARRDRSLAEEFLAKLIDADAIAAKQSTDQTSRSFNDSWTTSEETSKRLNFAQRLLDENEPEKAFEFAVPALIFVNERVISFLSRLRRVRSALADKQFMLLLARAELDPTADANTVSGLSSYAFTPGLYLTFLADGSVRWSPALDPMNAPDLPLDVKAAFFRAAATILLRPSLPGNQDSTSAGLIGKYMVIKRLLPLFEQHASNAAIALRSQLITLGEQLSNSIGDEDDFLLTQGITSELDSRTVIDQLEERVARAKDERARDEIYADAAAILASQGNTVAQDIADKIDNVYRREIARQYVDMSLLRSALSKKDAVRALSFAQSRCLTHVQRSWAYLKIAPLLMNSDRTRAVDLLEEALAEARRMDADDVNRALLMIGVATHFLTTDLVRCWEVGAEAIRAANASERFSGEVEPLRLALVTSSGLKLMELDTAGLDLSALIVSLTEHDLARANDLAKSFRHEAPHALATLAVATAVMKKNKQTK